MSSYVGILVLSLLGQTPTPPPASPPAMPPAPAAAADQGIGETGESGLASNSSLNPQMVGDLGRRGYRLVSPSFDSSLSLSPSASASAIRLPVLAPALKIAENESPRPLDRVFGAYNFYDNLRGIGAPGFDLHRETFGFEKTFLDGDASFGVRVPVFQAVGRGNGDVDGFGSASVLLKYAFVNDAATGNVASAGLMVTLPTGRRTLLDDGDRLQAFYLQPWVGFIYNLGPAYVHGFSSVAFAVEAKDVTFLSNDVGVGYRLYQGNEGDFVSSLTPTLEAHVFTPLNNRGQQELIQAFHDVVLTAGTHFGFRNNRVILTTAAAMSLCGPRQFDVEWISQLNIRF